MSVLLIDKSKRLDIAVRRGQTINKNIPVIVKSTGDPFDFTGYVGSLQVMSSESDSVPNILFEAGEGLTIDVDGITLEKPHTMWTPKLRRRKYIYYLWMTDADDVRELWLNGFFFIQEGVTPEQTQEDSIEINLTAATIVLEIGGSGSGVNLPLEAEGDFVNYLVEPETVDMNDLTLVHKKYVDETSIKRLIRNFYDEGTGVTLEVTNNVDGYMHVRVKSTGDDAGGGFILGESGVFNGEGQELLPIIYEGMMAMKSRNVSPNIGLDSQPGFFIWWVDTTGQPKFNFKPAVGDPVQGEFIKSGNDLDTELPVGLLIKNDAGQYRHLRVDAGGTIYIG